VQDYYYKLGALEDVDRTRIINIDIEEYSDSNNHKIGPGNTYKSLAENKKLKSNIRTGDFKASIMIGAWNKVEIELYTCRFLYDKFVFTDCHFTKDSFIDEVDFKHCKFINCIIEGRISFVNFIECEFLNTEFRNIAFRKTTIKSNCTFIDSYINLRNFADIDGYLYILGKRYKEWTGWKLVNEKYGR